VKNFAIEVHDLTKVYGEGGVRALDDVTFDVGEGEIFGYLGRNGAGKSTTVRILTTLLRPSNGWARVGGFDVVQDSSEVCSLLGVVLQEAGLDDLMTGREHLVLGGRVIGLGKAGAFARADELLETFGLTSAADRLASRYSGGMRRRLAVAMALLRRPPVLFLDEPTTGLDPQSRSAIWDIIRQVREEGSTVFLTTQHLAEADQLADRVCVLQAGRIVAVGTPQDLKARFGPARVNVRVGSVAARDKMRAAVTGNRVDEDGEPGWLSISVAGGEAAVPAVVARLVNSGEVIERLSVSAPTLEDVFLTLTGTQIESSSDISTGAAVAAIRRVQGVRTNL
jgi:ABC-2 type transport system ATP-binding protein